MMLTRSARFSGVIPLNFNGSSRRRSRVNSWAGLAMRASPVEVKLWWEASPYAGGAARRREDTGKAASRRVAIGEPEQYRQRKKRLRGECCRAFCEDWCRACFQGHEGR